VNYPNFGMPNYQMPVSGAKYGGMGQNSMVLPGSYGGDPYSVGSGGVMGYSGPFAQPYGQMNQQPMRQPQYGGYPQMGMQQPLMRNRGMRPFRGQNAMNSQYGQMPSPYASIE
jgi:hypothetical protein